MQWQFSLADGEIFALQPPTLKDVPRVYEAADSSREELTPWSWWCHQDYCLADADNWVRETIVSESEHSFLIVDERDLCVGTCGLNRINDVHRSANLGYWVRTSHTKRGIASAATLKVAEFAFQELELVRVEIVAALGNQASQRVAGKVGATREGILRNGLMHHAGAHDAVMFSLIPDDLS